MPSSLCCRVFPLDSSFCGKKIATRFGQPFAGQMSMYAGKLSWQQLVSHSNSVAGHSVCEQNHWAAWRSSLQTHVAIWWFVHFWKGSHYTILYTDFANGYIQLFHPYVAFPNGRNHHGLLKDFAPGSPKTWQVVVFLESPQEHFWSLPAEIPDKRTMLIDVDSWPREVEIQPGKERNGPFIMAETSLWLKLFVLIEV